ncbi:MAG: hypothetical protein Q7S73_00395 [bacterium]|nr:hypothetical protein [bacterium]
MKFRVEFLSQVPQLMIIHLDCEFKEEEFGEFAWPSKENVPRFIQDLLKINGIYQIKCYNRYFLDVRRSLAVSWDDLLPQIMGSLLLSTDPLNTAEETAPPLTKWIDTGGYWQLLPINEKHKLRTFSAIKTKNPDGPNKK